MSNLLVYIWVKIKQIILQQGSGPFIDIHMPITKNVYNTYYSEGKSKTLTIGNSKDLFENPIRSSQQEIVLDSSDKRLVQKINTVHILCGKSDFDFERNYKQALNHIENRPSTDWYECAAKDLVHFKEGLGKCFFDVFKSIDDSLKKDIFNEKKDEIQEKYKIIQGIKHGNTDSVYRLVGCKNISDDDYQIIFNDLITCLKYIFNNFELDKL